MILIDEPSVARPGALFVFQSLMDGARALTCEETAERVPMADGVTIILADNTQGSGDETGGYEGTRALNIATMDRCGILARIDYLPAPAETQVLIARTGCTPELAALAVHYATQTRDAAIAGRAVHGVGLRRLIAWCELVTDGITPINAYDLAIHHMSAPDDRETLRQLYRAHMVDGDVRKARVGQ